jgi:FtsZ-interacting cell division protein YlmF
MPSKTPARAKQAPQKMPRKRAAALAQEPRDYRSPTQIQIEERTGRQLTQRQKKFAENFVAGVYTNKRAAILAGYAERSASMQATTMLDPKQYPQVTAYIAELQEEKDKLYGVTLMGQLKRLSDLSRGAETAGQYSAAINAEKLRSALGGLTIDRRETVNVIDQMTKNEILGRLAELQRKFPHAFSVIEGEFDPIIEGKAIAHHPDD